MSFSTLTTLAAWSALVPLVAAPAVAPEDPFDRALDRGVARAQRQLESSLELWVDRSKWSNPWRVKHGRYEVRTTESWVFGRDLARDLDTMIPHYQKLTDTKYEPPSPFVILVFPDLASYNNFGGNFAEHSSFYGSFLPAGQAEQAVATYYAANPILMRMWATHSAVHQYIERAFSNAPPLPVSEGLASYFALFWDYSYGINELDRIKKENKVVPLQSLLNAPIQAYMVNPQERLIELGMLFTYLLTFREDTKSETKGIREIPGPFAEYLRGVLNGRNMDSHPVHALLTKDLNQLQEEFLAFDGWSGT